MSGYRTECIESFTPGQAARMIAVTLIQNGTVVQEATVPLSFLIPSGYIADLRTSTIRFGTGAALTVSGVLNASAVTLTASNLAQGWNGVRFNPGSGGTWTAGTIVERVAGELIGGPTADLFAATVTVTGASPTFTDVTLRNPIAGTSVSGLAVIGAANHTTAPVLTTSSILNMTAQGATVNGAASLEVRRGTISGTTGGAALVTSGGAATQAFLVRYSDGTNERGPVLTANTGGGVFAAGGSEVRLGTIYASTTGFGLASVRNNSGRGIRASGGSSVYAGSGTVAGGAYQRNAIFGNGGTSTTGNSYATGTGSRVYARCNWWNTTDPSGFRIGAASGGLVDASYFLLSDPVSVINPDPNPVCTNASEYLGRSASGQSAMQTGAALRGTPEAEASALDRLAEAMTATDAADALGQFAALVDEMPETEAATAALGEAAMMAGRADALPAATALLISTTSSAHAGLRVAAWQGLVASRRAQGDRAGALAAAAALAAEGGEALVPAETARVYLHAEAGDSTAAFVALAALEALAPESVEAEMARALLGVAPASGRTVATNGADPAGKAGRESDPAAFGLGIAPNPAGASATLTLTLAEAADVAVTVYDLLGRAVQTVPVAAMPAGAHRVVLDASRWAPSVYVVRAVANTAAGAVVQTARLTIAR